MWRSARRPTLAARRGVVLDLRAGRRSCLGLSARGPFDLVVDIFSQFSAPADRARKWAGMARTLRPGGHLILQGYTPDQLRHGTGGPKDPAHLYTEDLLRSALPGWDILHLEASETMLDEGPGHSGPSAVIGLLARRPA